MIQTCLQALCYDGTLSEIWINEVNAVQLTVLRDSNSRSVTTWVREHNVQWSTEHEKRYLKIVDLNRDAEMSSQDLSLVIYPSSTVITWSTHCSFAVRRAECAHVDNVFPVLVIICPNTVDCHIEAGVPSVHTCRTMLKSIQNNCRNQISESDTRVTPRTRIQRTKSDCETSVLRVMYRMGGLGCVHSTHCWVA
jgi:hypothetical protein